MAPSFLDRLLFDQQGTTLSVVGVRSKNQINQLKEFMKGNGINFSRTINLLEDKEVIFHMTSEEDAAAAKNFLSGT
jgi:hypothetical protein